MIRKRERERERERERKRERKLEKAKRTLLILLSFCGARQFGIVRR